MLAMGLGPRTLCPRDWKRNMYQCLRDMGAPLRPLLPPPEEDGLRRWNPYEFDHYVLLIGNSFVGIFEGLDMLMHDLSSRAYPRVRLAADKYTVDGQPLSHIARTLGHDGIVQLLNSAPTRRGMQRFLVLQDDLPDAASLEDSKWAHEAFKKANEAANFPFELVVMGIPQYDARHKENTRYYTVEQTRDHARAMAETLGARHADCLTLFETLSATDGVSFPLRWKDNEHPTMELYYGFALVVLMACFGRVEARFPQTLSYGKKKAPRAHLTKVAHAARQTSFLEARRLPSRWLPWRG